MTIEDLLDHLEAHDFEAYEVALKIATALADVMDGVQAHEVQEMTGLSHERSLDIYEVGREAISAVYPH